MAACKAPNGSYGFLMTVFTRGKRAGGKDCMFCPFCEKGLKIHATTLRRHLESCPGPKEDADTLVIEGEEHPAQEAFVLLQQRCVAIETRRLQVAECMSAQRSQQATLPFSDVTATTMSVMRFIAANGLPLSLVDDPYFREMLPGGQLLPKRDYFRNKALPALAAQASAGLQSALDALPGPGTLISDGWTSPGSRSLINFLLIYDGQVLFLDCIDTSGHRKTAEYIADITAHQIQKYEKHIFSVVTDNPNVNRKARELLKARFPKIVFSSCCVHGLNNLLRDWGSLEPFASTIEDVKRIVLLIMNNGTLLHLLRTSQQNNPVVLTKPCETRFGSNVQMLLRIVRLKDVVRALFVSQTFSDARDALPPNKKLVANRCRENCLDDAFWAHIDLALEVLAPAYALLRTVDTPAAAISEVYFRMFRLQLSIEELADQGKISDEFKMTLLSHHLKRWNEFHSPLHSAAAVLDPRLLHVNLDLDANIEVCDDFQTLIPQVLPDLKEEDTSQLREEFRAFRGRHAAFMGLPCMKKEDVYGCTPRETWRQLARHLPLLSRLAITILSQAQSASSCESNWSIYKDVWSLKRNRLHSRVAQQLVSSRMYLRAQVKKPTISPPPGFIEKSRRLAEELDNLPDAEDEDGEPEATASEPGVNEDPAAVEVVADEDGDEDVPVAVPLTPDEGDTEEERPAKRRRANQTIDFATNDLASLTIDGEAPISVRVMYTCPDGVWVKTPRHKVSPILLLPAGHLATCVISKRVMDRAVHLCVPAEALGPEL
eukprot:m.197725 g.197725  ORF g.197725 m.197725 type:complete len:772 (-) comp10649_c0_seq8:227-2542(-)